MGSIFLKAIPWKETSEMGIASFKISGWLVWDGCRLLMLASMQVLYWIMLLRLENWSPSVRSLYFLEDQTQYGEMLWVLMVWIHRERFQDEPVVFVLTYYTFEQPKELIV